MLLLDPDGEAEAAEVAADAGVEHLRCPGRRNREKRFEFEQVFGDETSQEIHFLHLHQVQL